MRKPFRQTLLIGSAFLGLSAMTAMAASPGSTDPTATTPGATAPSTSSSASAAPGDQSGAQANQSMSERIEQRISDLHAKLQITPAQEPEWKKFAQTMRDNAKKMDQTFESRVQQISSMNALENMRSYARISMQHAQDVEHLVPPFQALYSSMSEAQKHAADEVFREDANRGEQQAKHG